jgi:hypothetical protein
MDTALIPLALLLILDVLALRYGRDSRDLSRPNVWW